MRKIVTKPLLPSSTLSMCVRTMLRSLRFISLPTRLISQARAYPTIAHRLLSAMARRPRALMLGPRRDRPGTRAQLWSCLEQSMLSFLTTARPLRSTALRARAATDSPAAHGYSKVPRVPPQRVLGQRVCKRDVDPVERVAIAVMHLCAPNIAAHERTAHSFPAHPAHFVVRGRRHQAAEQSTDKNSCGRARWPVDRPTCVLARGLGFHSST